MHLFFLKKVERNLGLIVKERFNTKDSSCNVFFYIEVLFFVMDFFIGCWVDDRLDELTERGRPNLAANLASGKIRFPEKKTSEKKGPKRKKPRMYFFGGYVD